MKKILFILYMFTLISCLEDKPNVNTEGEDILETYQVYVEDVNLNFRDSIYVPIYSDIYSFNRQSKLLLTATLSVRNTSIRDSIFIDDIDYYDSKGKLVRQYIDKTILLEPLQTIDYVIDHEDQMGGTGANFIVNWGCNNPTVKPIFQGIMISTKGQHGISFVTEGVSISQR